MKVFICYEHSYNFCDEWKWVVKVVADELNAMEWETSMVATETSWRSYEEITVQ